jgi:heme exporter protein D
MRFSFPLDAGPFVWLLLVLAFLALVFVVERALFLHRGLVLSSDFIEGVRNNLRRRPPRGPRRLRRVAGPQCRAS